MTTLFRPSAFEVAASADQTSEFPIFGADDVQISDEKITANFSGDQAAGVLLDHQESISGNLELIFTKDSDREFLFRGDVSRNIDLDLSIHAQENSEVHCVILLSNPAESTGKINISVQSEKNAKCYLTLVHLTAGEFSSEILCENIGEHAESHITVLEVGSQQAKSQFQIESRCNADHSQGNIRTFTALFDQAFCQMQGMPNVMSGKYGCENHLDQQSLLLSDKTRMYSVPLLAIANNQVKASHKSSITRLMPEDLFYFSTRGVQKPEAEQLLLDGFIEKTLHHIPEAEMQSCVTDAIHHFLSRDEH